MSEKPYQPIDCGYYDFIEATILRGQPVTLVAQDAAGEPQTRHLRLLDTWVAGGEEFLVLAGGERLRMDRIISIEGHPRPEAGDTCARPI